MAKRSQPALYELIRNQGDSPAPMPSGGGGFRPPQPWTIAPVTAGFLAAAVLGLVLVAYLYGFAVGQRVVQDRMGQQAAADLDRLVEETDPSPAPTIAGGQPPSIPTAPPAIAGSGNPASGGLTGAIQPQSPTGDPRIEGLNYFVIAQVPAASADRMVAFSRERDLDAHSVPDDTGGLRFVIVTPGFAAGERRSEPVLRLEARIRSVGLQWKSAARGNRDFSDFYPRKFAAKAG
jgi:hypothetical protein